MCLCICMYLYICGYATTMTQIKGAVSSQKKKGGICGHSLWIWPLLLRNDLQVCQRLILSHHSTQTERLQRSFRVLWHYNDFRVHRLSSPSDDEMKLEWLTPTKTVDKSCRFSFLNPPPRCWASVNFVAPLKIKMRAEGSRPKEKN